MSTPGTTTLLHRETPAWRMLALAGLAIAALLGMASPALADDDLPGRVGRVADVAGELFLAPQDQPEQWTAIGINYPVTTGDNLWVGNDGRAEVDFGAGQFRLAGDSNLHVSRLDDRQFALFVAQGRVSVRVRVLDPGETASIDTPNAQVVLTRPGLYRIDVSEDRQQTRLVVREGEANVLTPAAVQQVLPGQTAVIDGADARYASVSNGVGTDGFDAWVANRDRRYERGTYANYVSPQMVGAAELDQYGTWSQVPEYGAVWYPTAVEPDWAPYRNGYWADVGAWGPTWVDAAPWGYAPFHYGRWVFVGSRWGWCPGTYVARPLWAPALVGWTGGPGWGISVNVGGPVFGWVPLAWGEPYRPWWNRCSHGCWDRYNRPYAVNVVRVRPDGPPPTRYRNASVPGGMSAMSGNALITRRPVRENLVVVPNNVATSAPVLAGVPLVRSDPGRIPTKRAGEGAPKPASTFYPTMSRPSGTPGTPGAAAARPPVTTSAPGTMTRSRTDAPAPAYVSPGTRAAPATTSPFGGSTAPVPTTAAPTVTRQPAQTGAPRDTAPVATARPDSRQSPQYATPPVATTPTPGTPSGRQSPAVTGPVGTAQPARTEPRTYSPPAQSAPIQPQSGSVARPVQRTQPALTPAPVAPSVQPAARAQPAPVKVPNVPQQSAPVAPQAPVRAQPPAAPAKPAADQNVTRQGRGDPGTPGGPDKPPR